MKHSIRERWIEALRSGRYTKVTGRLGQRIVGNKEGNCAYGVLCELAVADGIITKQQRSFGMVFYDGRGDYPSRTVLNWAGLSQQDLNGQLVSNYNDCGMAFDEIAKLIDTDPDRKFDRDA